MKVLVKDKYVFLYCPGCKDAHMITTGENGWQFDGNLEEPTITPSILVNGDPMFPNPNSPRCHSFVTKGEWEFQSDCTHKLAGLQAPMIDFPEGFSVSE